jgi:hypothetical protein
LKIFMRPTDKTAKPLLLNHHKWSWYIPWMIWDGFKGNRLTLCHEADWFVAWGQYGPVWTIRPDWCHFLAIIHETNWQNS